MYSTTANPASFAEPRPNVGLTVSWPRSRPRQCSLGPVAVGLPQRKAQWRQPDQAEPRGCAASP